MQLIIRWSPPAHDWQWPQLGAWQSRLHCALLGHDDEIVVGERVMALRCRRCRWRSSGWQLDQRPHMPPSRV
jgi:hypothetical protein